MGQIKRGKESTIREVFCRNIGVESVEEVNNWFRKSYSKEYYIKDLAAVVAFAKKFKKKPVRVVGDYDVDGVSACMILLMSLMWAGFENVTFRIPKRFSEGYGISNNIIDEIDEGLVITCDNGIAQIEAIKRAKDKGLSVIIIDHHLPVTDKNGNIQLPEADYIIDPHAIKESAAYNGYCGAGLCYKFACELLEYNKAFTQRLLGITAIATVCDVMELREENYVLVKNGMKALLIPTLNTSGLYALISAFQLTRHITAHDIGFKIGPAINACSRMKDSGADDALKLLMYNGPFPNAVSMAEKVIENNSNRKDKKLLAMQKAEAIIQENCYYGDVPLVVYVPEISEGLIGIIAGNLAEKYDCPAYVFTDAETDGELKGSARSSGAYNVKEEMDKCHSLFVKCGGHAGAGGMTILKRNFEELRIALINNCTDFEYSDEATDAYYDLEIKASEIPAVAKELKMYEPFGEGNPQIVFKVSNFSVVPRNGEYKRLIGNDLSIVKMYSSNAVAVGFDMAKKMHTTPRPERLDLVGTISENYFNGEVEPQVEFTDFIIKEKEMIETPVAARLKSIANSLSK